MRGLALLWLVLWGCVPAKTPIPDDDGGCFSIDHEALDFGEVPSFTVASQKLRLTNRTSEILLVSAEPFPPFSASTDGNPFLNPGGDGYLDVQFRPFDGLLHFGELEIQGGTSCVQRFPVRGLGSGRLEVDPASLAFGGVDVGESKVLEFKLTNTRRSDLTLENVLIVDETVVRPGFNSPFTSDAPSRIELAPMASITIHVTAAPRYAATLTARLTATDGATQIRLPMTVLGGTPVAQLSRDTFDVPIVNFSPDASSPSFVERAFLLRNIGTPNGALPLRVQTPALRHEDGGTLDGGFLLFAASAGIPAGNETFVVLRYFPSELGAHSYRLVLQTNEVNQPARLITFSATTFALPPCVLNRHFEEIFTPTDDGGSVGEVTFTNLGDTRCVIDDVRLRDSFVGFHLLDGGAEQLELAPGESHVVSLSGPGVFGPRSPGELNFHALAPNRQVEVVLLRPPP